MKTLLRNSAFGLGIALVATLGLFELGALAAPAAMQQAVVKVVATVADVVNPVPTPTPTPDPTPTPADVPPPAIPTPTVAPSPEPAAFPAIPPAIVIPTPGATPTQIAVPQTAVFVSANVQGDQHCPCPAPLTIEWVADFQGGFPGVTPTFKWSDGGTTATDTVTYTTPGTYHSPTVQAYEVYQGVTYMVGTGNPNITFEVK